MKSGPFVPTFEAWLRGWRQASDQTATSPVEVRLDLVLHVEMYHRDEAMRRYKEYVASLSGEKVAR